MNMPRVPLPALDTVRPRAVAEAGFTLVEVLVAIVVLTVGLLGTFAALRTSAHTTLTNRERQVETAVAREVVEDASSLSYTQLTSTALPGALQTLVANATTASGGLQVTRGPASYLVTLSVCSLDDPSDGYGKHGSTANDPLPASGGAWCLNQPADGSTDSAPDDEKRLSVMVQAISDSTAPTVQQTALIFNHGLPAVSCLTVTGTACPDSSQRVSYTSTRTLTFSVTTTTQAASLRWFVDGNPPGRGQLPAGASDPYVPAGTTSQFTWQIPQLTSPSSYTYTISVQAQNAQGDTGPRSTLQITVTY